MNRYKIEKSSYNRVKLYLAGRTSKKDVPSYAVKFKERLSFKGNTLLFEGSPVVPSEDVDSYLRKEFYDKKSDVPLSRDGAWHILKKRKVHGITRARLMKFLKAQSPVESTRNARPTPKQLGGKPVKAFHFQTDLVFVRKPDFVRVNKKFDQTIGKFETYIVSTCEVLSGICRLSWIQKKNEAMPHVVRHIKEIAKQLGIKNLKKYEGSSDSGSEFDFPKLRSMMKSWKIVKLGSKVENVNRQIQKRLFQLARGRRGFKIPNLLNQVEKITNNNLNSVQGQTPNEVAEEVVESKNEKDIAAKYNKKRRKYKSDIKIVFQVGDFVRINIIGAKAKVSPGFKSYKNITWSKRVYKVQKVTKNAVPQKIYVNKKWFTVDSLLKTEPVDQISEKLIETRDKQQEDLDDLEFKQHMKKQKEELLKQTLQVKAKAPPAPKRKKPRLKRLEKLAAETAAFLGEDFANGFAKRRGMIKGRAKRLARMEKLRKVDKQLGINPASF